MRLEDDFEIKCWENAHKTWTLSVALPSMIFWGLGIPLLALIYLYKLKNQIDDQKTRERWGFIFNGFKKNFYFWEIVISYRKILIIFISVFASSLGLITQALLFFLVILGFTLITIRFRPYQKGVF
jgi:hypothetical protein